jgi:flagellar basal-body rod protein FlgF
MDKLAITAASGMKARMESLEMLANNIANQSSAGYKADREFYSLYLAPEALDSTGASAIPLPATLPVIERPWTDFSQGMLQATGNESHLALEGAGFFVVRGPSGPLYTRNGTFRLSPSGQLQTAEGYPVMDDRDRPVSLDPLKPFEVSAAGEIRQQGNAVARMQLVDIRRKEALTKRDGSYFNLSSPSGELPRATGTVHQGKIEASNFNPASAAVRLIGVMRQFETLQRAVQIGGEMGRRSIEEVARVGN